MFREVEKWWNDMSDRDRDNLRRALSREGVKNFWVFGKEDYANLILEEGLMYDKVCPSSSPMVQSIKVRFSLFVVL